MRTIVTNLLLFFVLGSSLMAGSGGESDARAVGMGRAQTAVAENTEAFFWNPALLGLSEIGQSGLTMQFFGFGFRHGNNVLSISDYNKYNGRAFDEKDKRDFLKLFKGTNALEFNGDAELRGLGFQYRNYSFNVVLMGNGHVDIPESLFEMALSDYVVGEKKLQGHGSGTGQSFVSVDMSAGYPIREYFRDWLSTFDEVTAGMTLRYIQGLQQASLTDMFGIVERSDSLITRGRYRTETAKGGNGMGIDLGLAAKLDRYWTFGISLRNAYSQIRWKTGSRAHQGNFSIRASDIFDIDFRDDYKDSLGVKHSDSTKYNSTRSDSGFAINSYNKKLPMVLRIGAGYQLNRNILLALDLEHHLNNAAGPSVPRIAAGMEYAVSDRLFLRSGMSVGGDNRGFNVSGGCGFFYKRLRFDVATNNLEGLITLRRFSFALNVKTDLN